MLLWKYVVLGRYRLLLLLMINLQAHIRRIQREREVFFASSNGTQVKMNSLLLATEATRCITIPDTQEYQYQILVY